MDSEKIKALIKKYNDKATENKEMAIVTDLLMPKMNYISLCNAYKFIAEDLENLIKEDDKV